MQSKQGLFFLIFCFLNTLLAGEVYAQDTLVNPIQNRDTLVVKTLERDTIAVVDTILATTLTNEFPKTIVNTSIKDSVIYRLPDDPLAARLDSVWRKELYRYDLYDSIQQMVRETHYIEEVIVDLPVDTLKKRLAEINARTPFNVVYNPSLESVIRQYLKRHKPAMERLMAVSEFYFPMFEETLDKYDIPLEMKYLAIVESALRPKAKSRVGATGLWQFMFSTGKLYGLEVNSYVDDRMDPIKATEAACQYLAKLYASFGDWDLALASYNSGPGNVSKAIRRSGGYQNYWNIRDHLPRETAGYVPAFLATMYLFEYADVHGYQPEKPPVNYFATDTIQVKETITLDQVAEVTGLPMEEVQFLNPSYKLDIIPKVKDKPYYLRLPVEVSGKFVNNEASVYAFAKAELDKREKPLPQLFNADAQIRYRVKNGDYLGKIAERYGVRVSQIKRWNGLRSNNLKIGQRLTIYPRNPVTTTAVKKPKNVEGKQTYTVQSGDSLWKIANKFPGVSVENIKVWNDISGTRLKPGIKLIVSK